MPKPRKTHYRNRLPHLAPELATFFITFRLADSLPRSHVEEMLREMNQKLTRLKEDSPEQYRWKSQRIRKETFGKFDHQLDIRPFGECHLKNPEIANCLAAKLHDLDGSWYSLLTYCIMPNHVHVMLDTRLRNLRYRVVQKEIIPLHKIMQKVKGGSAYEINRILGRAGKFWQKDSYDHVVRNAKEEGRIRSYILNNPVKAGLVGDWREYPFCYCNLRG